ncbi:MAG: DUF1549 domain-containing protein, partial [Planctomycetaceae bacterium]|nr:DUF1549 domain-containing protein [Planctomycetaceae bacterium]
MISFCVTACQAEEAQSVEFFEREVLPILKSQCYGCHSHASGTMEGQLALDWKSGWETGGESGPAIVPGKPDESLLIEAVRRESFEMPPDAPLPEAEIEILVQWIQNGATDPRTVAPEKETISTDWWSLKPLQRPPVPEVETADHPVDRFVDARLKESGLSRSPRADRRTLIRRLAYDLHGLPPTPEDVESFANDPSPLAWEHLIDEYLSSPRYGERWARH